MKEMTPSSFTQEPAKTGTKMRSTSALWRSPSSSSCVSASPSRYFTMRSSSASTTSSQRASRASWSVSAYSAGTGPSTGLPFSRWRATWCTTSMTPEKASPVPMGSVTAARRGPKCSFRLSSVVAKSASARSMRFTKTARARERSSAANQRRVVTAAGPPWASTTKSAVSQALMAA